MLKRLLGWVSPSGPKARLSVLILHRVLPEPDPLFPDEMHAHRFDELCGWLAGWFNVLPLDQAMQHLKTGTLPSRAACITFDDGYADNFHVALPILQRHGLTATFFIATGFLDGGCMWNDRVIESVRMTPLPVLQLDRPLGAGFSSVPVGSIDEKRSAIRAIIGQLKYQPVAKRADLTEQIAKQAQVRPPTDLMMTSSEVRALRQAGMQIGAHTVSHPILATLDRAAARAEIVESKRVLETLLEERVGLFAYPNGKPQVDYNSESIDIVRELGFDAAVCTRWAASRADTEIFQIPRFTPWDKTRLRFGARMLANLRSA